MLKDVRVFLNTLSRSIDLMKQGGIDAGIQREETDDSLILTISIPKARQPYACDMEFDDAEGRIVSLVTPGRAKFFGLLGREDDYVLPWQSIVRIGSDIILVDCKGEVSRRKRRRRSLI